MQLILCHVILNLNTKILTSVLKASGNLNHYTENCLIVEVHIEENLLTNLALDQSKFSLAILKGLSASLMCILRSSSK